MIDAVRILIGDVRCLPHKLDEPMHWRTPRRVFVNSMSDLFHESVPFEFVDRVFAVMALCPRHIFQVLTKRPERMAEWASRGPMPIKDAEMMRRGEEIVFRWPLPNVWLGASVERQQEADERIPHLLRCPAALRFLSCEPLLGPVDLTRVNFGAPGVQNVLDCRVSDYAKRAGIDKLNGIDWVIVGGESGPHARPCDVAWIRSIVKQCQDAGVPCFVKQLGAMPIFPSPRPCPDCNGEGREMIPCDPDDTRCEFCNGTGTINAELQRVRLRDPKGGDQSEWPEDLRVRQFPEEFDNG